MISLKRFKKIKAFSMGFDSSKPVLLHVSTPISWRGGEQQLFYLMDSLETKEVKQYLICNVEGEMYKKAKAHGLNVIGCKKRNGMDLGFARQLKALCSKLNVEVVHAHDSQAHTLTLLANVLFGNKIPVVLSRRVDFPVGGSFFSRYKYNHPMVAKILCVSNAIKEVMRNSIKNKELLQTVYSGIDLKRVESVNASNYLKENFNVPAGYKMIGNVAAIAPHKDYFTFVDTAEILIKQGFKAKFFIIGTGPEGDAIKQYVKDKNLQKEIYFTGFFKEVLPVLKSLDLMLVTSKTEGLGTTILDAFACGVPVVATRAGGIPEIVKHDNTGLTGEVESPNELSKLVVQLFEEDQLKEKLTKNAKHLLSTFSKEHTAMETLKVYQSIIA